MGSRLVTNRISTLGKLLPTNLVSGIIQSSFVRVPKADLIYSYNHPVFRRRPWVAYLEWFNVLLGRNAKHFKNFRWFARRVLASEDCKAVVSWPKIVVSAIIENYGDDRIARKTNIVPLAVPPKRFVRPPSSGLARILFVGSRDSPLSFLPKGGLETVKAFAILRKGKPETELVIRARVPEPVAAYCAKVGNIRIIDSLLSDSELEKEFISAQIFIQPTHDTPYGAFLDAMSYGLPVVTRAASLNSEIVTDGETGFVVPSSKEIRYFVDYEGLKFVPAAATDRRVEFLKSIYSRDDAFVKRLADTLSILLEDDRLRRRMGDAARKKVEIGDFSISRRNAILKQVFDRSCN
jgi:glycosyltransferase involved in cell wall biosynthesis